MTDIPIDTADYEARYGGPAGRAFWKFRIVSADSAIRDHDSVVLHKPTTFPRPVDKRELAKIPGSEQIVLLLNQ